MNAAQQLAQATQNTADAFAKLCNELHRLTKPRRRRSRQCRGSRARNYVRAVGRAINGSAKSRDANVQAILQDATATGALAATRRNQVWG